MSEILISIDGKDFEAWSSFELSRSIGTSDTFGLTAPMQPDNKAFRDIFTPLSFKSVDVSIDGDKELTGVMLGVTPGSGPDSAEVSINGYSKAGVLNDCQIPSTEYPIEYQNLNLLQIAQKVAGHFGVPVSFQAAPGPQFEQVGATTSENALDFLASLAKERGLIIGSDVNGGILFQKANVSGRPVASIQDGEPGVSNVRLNTTAQELFSTVTGHGSTTVGFPPDSYTAENSRISVFRPLVFKSDGASQGDVKAEVEAKIGRMYGAALTVSLDLASWQDPSGNLWRPNTLIQLLAPDAMIYSKTIFLIKSATLNQTSDSETASLTLVMPESYDSKIPVRLPWE